MMDNREKIQKMLTDLEELLATMDRYFKKLEQIAFQSGVPVMELNAQLAAKDAKIAGLRRILRDRENELLLAKGPCSNGSCSLHYAHSGPCDGRAAAETTR